MVAMIRKGLFILLIFLGMIETAAAQQTVGLFQNDSLSQNGYTLFTAASRSYLIDNCGRVVNQWTHSSNPGLACYLTNDGELLRAGNQSGAFVGGGVGGRLERYSWDNELLWSSLYATEDHHQHHDLEPMDNGNFLLIAWEAKTAGDAVANGAENAVTYSPLRIVEVEPIGSNSLSVVWEWHVWDHLIQDFDSGALNFGVVSDHPELVDINANPPSGGFSGGDWQHANGIDYNAERDEIAISVKDFGEIWIIDHSTTSAEAASHSGGNSGKGGDLLYRWGNPANYGRGTNDDQIFHGQHDVKWLPEGHPNEGGFSVFNNGIGQPGVDYSTADIFMPVLDSNGNYADPGTGAYGPEDVIWSYEDNPPTNMFSQNQGGTQAQPNGNMLINVTTQGRTIEVTPDGEVVWEYRHTISGGGPVFQGQQWNQSGGGSFRFERYLPDFPGLIGKDLTPGDPIELNPLPSDCQIFEPTTLAEQVLLSNVYTYFDPLDAHLYISNRTTEAIDYRCFDLSGRLIESGRISDSELAIDINRFSDGVYLVHLTGIDSRRTRTNKIIK